MRSREIAGAAGVTVKTLRHYHRIGLLPEPPRSENGYRDYRVEDLVLLLRIRRFADLGFSLGAIRSLIAEEERADCALARLEADLAEAEAGIRRKLRTVRALRSRNARGDEPEAFADHLLALQRLGAGERLLSLERDELLLIGALDFDGDLSSVRLELGRFLDERSLTKRYVDLGERIMALSEASGEDDVEGAVSEGEAFCEEIADFLLAQAGKRGVGARAGSRSPRLLYDAAVDALERGLLNEVQIEVYGRIERFAFGIVRRAAS